MNPRTLRILFVLPQVPYPPDRGGKIVQYNFVRGMLERGHRVWIAALEHHREEPAQAEALRKMGAEVITFPAAPRWSLSRLVRAFGSSRPYKAHRFYHPAMADWIQQCVDEQEIDVIHCQNFYTASYVRGNEPCGRILYKENFEALLLERFVTDSGHSAVLRAAARLQVRRTLAYEVSVCKRFDRVLLISQPDLERFAEHRPESPLEVLSPGVDLRYYVPSTRAPKAGRVVFTGSMDYFPNVDAVGFVCSKVWPRVRETMPEAELFLVGQHPEAAVRKWDGRAGVHVTGRVEDIRPYLADTAVYVVPLRVGGGVRLKILEAMAMGKAIVSTPLGAEGLAVSDGENILLAETPQAMAEAVLRLLRSEEERRRLEAAARAFAERHGDWNRIIERLENIYQEIAPPKAKTP